MINQGDNKNGQITLRKSFYFRSFLPNQAQFPRTGGPLFIPLWLCPALFIRYHLFILKYSNINTHPCKTPFVYILCISKKTSSLNCMKQRYPPWPLPYINPTLTSSIINFRIFQTSLCLIYDGIQVPGLICGVWRTG